MSFDLNRIIDKLEPNFGDDSSFLNTKYYNNVDEIIEEREDDEEAPGLLTLDIFSKIKAQNDKGNSYKFLQLGTPKAKKLRSLCLESEPILEELEEYQPPEIDQHNHTFIVPRWSHSAI
jgi:hypothetical protein